MGNKSTIEKGVPVSWEKFYEMLTEQQRLEEQQQSSKETDENLALETSIEQPKESDLSANVKKIKTKAEPFLLLFLLTIMFLSSFIGVLHESMEAYIAFPIAIVSLVGLIITIKVIKNRKRE